MKIYLDKFETVTVKTEEAVPTPKHYCATCSRMDSNLTCDCFQRRVEPNHNRCFNHSSYISPSIKAIFKPLPKDEMDAIVAVNEAAA